MVKMNRPSETSYGINIEDAFDVQNDYIVELTELTEYNGISKQDGKPYVSVVWHFRIFDDNGLAFVNVIDGAPFDSWQFSSMSLGQKSVGRAWASALLGRTLTDDDCDELADNFDAALVGKRALASWKLEPDKASGDMKLKIALLRPTRKPTAGRPVNDAAVKAAAAAVFEREQAAQRVANGNGSIDDVRAAATPVTAPARKTAAQIRAELAEAEAAEQGEAEDAPF